MKTILIVEDNKSSMELFNSILTRNGYLTLQARTGREALELAAQNRPDLILMDFLLPEISGLDATRMIKEDGALKDIPVIATTAFPFQEDEETFAEGGFDAYVIKPVSIPELLETVTKFVAD